MTYRDITLDDQSHTVTKNGTFVDLSPIEYRLLLFFMMNAGQSLEPLADSRSRVELRIRR